VAHSRYWACFVTKSPDGVFKKAKGKGFMYHVQFFNWNDESGWVDQAKYELITLAAFKSKLLLLSQTLVHSGAIQIRHEESA